MLRTLALRDIYTVHNESQIWSRGETSLLAKSRKALAVLNDSRIAYLIESLHSDEIDFETEDMLLAELSVYFLYVTHCGP